jgi:hypothetical protein
MDSISLRPSDVDPRSTRHKEKNQMKTQMIERNKQAVDLQPATISRKRKQTRHQGFATLALTMAFAMVIVMALTPMAANAQAYEHFAYTVGSPINSQNGGAGWGAPWTGFGDLVVSPGVSVTCNGLAPLGNALGPTPGNASSRPLGVPITGAAGTSMLLSAVIRSNVNGTGPTQATLGNSAGGTFIIGDLPENDPQASNWGMQNGNGVFYSTKPVVANAETCLVAQIDFAVSSGNDRMRLWVNPPANRFLATADIDVTVAHVTQFSGVFWQTQQGQAVDEISVTSMSTAALNCVSPPNTTMVAWYDFDETSGGLSSNLATANTGVQVGGPTPVPGMVAGALSFNGINQYVDSPTSIVTNFGPGIAGPIPFQLTCSGDDSTCQGDFSIDTWMEIPAVPFGVATIVDKRTGSPPLINGYSFYLYNNMMGIQLADGLGAQGYSNYLSPVLPTNLASWHHIAVTVQRAATGGITWYYDGVPIGNSTPTDRRGSLVNNSPLRIGANTTAPPFSNWFLGNLDELEIFNRVLLSSEVKSIYNAQQYGKCKP